MKEEQAEEVELAGGEMSFWEHLEILRWSLFHIVCVLAVVTVATFIAMPYIFDDYILAPTSSDFFVYKFINQISMGLMGFDEGFKVDIININVASQFMTHINTSLSLACVITFPFIVYEIWRYIRPALFANEVKHMRLAFLGGTIMFFIGCAIGYLLVFPFTFRFLTEYQLSPEITNQINLQSYIDNFTMMILIMGIVFEMPLLAYLLSQLGILRKGFLREYRRHAIVILMVTAAIITPSGDPFTLMLVFLPLWMLYELSILVVKEDSKDDDDEDE